MDDVAVSGTGDRIADIGVSVSETIVCSAPGGEMAWATGVGWTESEDTGAGVSGWGFTVKIEFMKASSFGMSLVLWRSCLCVLLT